MIKKWLNTIQNDLKCFSDVNSTLEKLQVQYDSGILKVREMAGGKGIVACFVFEDFFGEKVCSELIVYIKPEHRGNSRLFIKMVREIEKIAKENGCTKVCLGASIGYKDDSVIKIYKRLGYKTTGVSKSCVQEQKL